MTNSIESLLKLITSDEQTQQKIKALAQWDTEQDNENKTELQTSVTDDKLELKINLINAMLPFLDEKTTEKARFLIKLITIISLIRNTENQNN